MDPEKAIQRANDINQNEKHSYDSYKRIKSSNKEDKNALVKVKKLAATEKYGIAGPGKSCIEIAQTAFESLVEDRDLDAQWWKLFKDSISGESDLIPNNWFNKLEERVKSVNKNGDESSTKIELISTENL